MTSSNRNGTVYKTSGCTFTSSETKDIYLMVAELNRRATSHQDILPHLQDLQEQWLDSYNHLTKRQIILKAQEKRISLLGKDHASYDGDMKRWLNYKLKVESAISAHNTTTKNFQEMLYKERRLRLDLEELEQELRQLLSVNIEIRLQKTLENMAKTIDLVDLDCSNIRYQVVKSRIQSVNARDIVDSLLRNCCMEYEYPNIQEFIQTTGFSEPLPGGEMICLSRHRKVRMGDKEFLTSFPRNFGDDTSVGMDRNTNNGCYLKAVWSKPSSGPGFLKLKRDHIFKQKLTAMNGEVAFGWSRKGRIGQKSWGFYDSRLVTRVV
ncbi:uncharacterized protein LOC117342909 [Pecten maximus]|uniref:uncharacterized protein LOC117342909 n=1 Tax=Pecten maximus TaxID=6579 RepID=UPI001458C35E|nr:uncharacterized protein LOC117342909 [Pecten maximus]